MKASEDQKIQAIVIGASAGGIHALSTILSDLPASFSLPIIVVLHIPSSHPSTLPQVFKGLVKLEVKEAEEKEKIKAGTIYFAPPGYHLLIEKDHTFSFSNEEPVCFSRPSIDVTFESAAWTYERHLLGLLLTGANTDGSNGMKKILKYGGTTMIQNPTDADYPEMPRSAQPYVLPENILGLQQIAAYLVKTDQQIRKTHESH